MEFRTKRTVEFVHTDMAGIVHFSEYFKYMESVEHEFFRSLGISVFMYIENRKISWPRVSCSFDYKKPILFESEIDICLTVEKLGKKSLTYKIVISHENSVCATGKMTIVCCEYLSDDSICSIEIPPQLRTHLQKYAN